MSRSKRIVTYVTPEQKEFLKEQAKASNSSISRYIAKLIARDQLVAAEDQTSADFLAEERIRTLIASGKEELTGVARFVEDLTARRSCYAIANWEYLKKIAKELDLEITDNHRRMFLRKAAKRLRKPLEGEEERVRVEWGEE